MQRDYSLRSPAVKRLMREAQELHEPTENYFAQPLDDNLFEWHFTVRGPPDSEFSDGIYHGRITFPPEYPMKPPSIMLLTPNGRFEIGKKICLSISGYHPETWQPSWSIRTVLLAIIGFMPTHGHGAIGSLDYTPDERKILAKRSKEWKCKECGEILKNMLKERLEDSETSKEENREAQALAAQINFKEEVKKSSGSTTDTTNTTSQAGAANQQIPQNPVNPFMAFQQQFRMPYPPPMFMTPQFQAMFPGGMIPPNMQMPGNVNPPQAANQNSNPTQPANQQPQSNLNPPPPSPPPPPPPPTATNQSSDRTVNQNEQPMAGQDNQVNQSQEQPSVRHRNVTQEQNTQPTPQRRPPTNTTTVQNNQNQGQRREERQNSSSLVLIILLSLAIAALMLRRIYITYEYKFDYDL
ncbi:uncharacterized protein LOC144453969 [Glandiceps talaboti]